MSTHTHDDRPASFHGRRLLARVRERCEAPSRSSSSTDQRQTCFAAGSRSPLFWDPGAMEIVVDDLGGPEIAAFLEEHIEEMKSISPPESKHALDLDGLRVPEITFWTMLEDGEVVGCGALKLLGDGHGEVKSMRIAHGHRGRGLASALLLHIVAEAERMGLTRLSLETGSFAFFEPARRLYVRHGFEYCAPFGDYVEDANSVFMTKTLA